LGIEGVIAKRLDSRYTLNNRSKDWLKIKSSRRHEAVVGGYTLNRGSDRSFSSLLFGVYENKKLRFIGQVGTGFNDKSQMEILKKLKPLETRECPFHTIPGVNRPENFRPNQPKASITWVKPELVAEVQYQELTDEGLMRHPSFRGLRTDKKAGEVTMEEPVHIPHRSLLKKSIEKKFPGKSRTVRNAVTRPREH
jgi:bifunctional non-homologous end joining protein LigD